MDYGFTKKYHINSDTIAENTNSENTNSEILKIFMEVIKQNIEFKELIIDQNKNILELTKDKNVTNNSNNTNCNNKFNLNLF